MSNDLSSSPESNPLREAVAEAEALAREQVAALWQLQADRIREQLESGWREQLAHVFTERFAEIRNRLEQDYQRATTEFRQEFAREEAERRAETAITEITDRLNQTARRMRHAESREVWIQAFLERAAEFCGRAALFAVRGRTLRFEAGLGLNEDQAGREIEVPLEHAPAFAAAIDTRETTVAAVSPGEVSDAVASLAGGSEEERAYLFPFSHAGQVVGVLYAEPGARGINAAGLELLSALAESTIEPAAEGAASPALVSIAPAAAAPLLSRADQEVHARAERFARTKVAEIMLYRMDKVRAGRAAGDLYSGLRDEIESAREAYRSEYLSAQPGLPDYLHQELVHTVAKGDVSALGESYPGPLA